jgi:hypothetical protein
VPVAAGPLTSLAGRPRAPPFDHDHARTLSQEMYQTRRSTGANRGNEPLIERKTHIVRPISSQAECAGPMQIDRNCLYPNISKLVVLDHESRHDLFQEKSMFYPHQKLVSPHLCRQQQSMSGSYTCSRASAPLVRILLCRWKKDWPCYAAVGLFFNIFLT